MTKSDERNEMQTAEQTETLYYLLQSRRGDLYSHAMETGATHSLCGLPTSRLTGTFGAAKLPASSKRWTASDACKTCRRALEARSR